MRYDFSDVEDQESFNIVPAGTYNCRIAEVRAGHAKDGSERWSLRLVVLDGECAGKTAAWDSITWSARGVYRVKRVLEALAFDVSGELEVQPAELVNREARVALEEEEWEHPESGRRSLRMTVPYLGYALANGLDPDGETAEIAEEAKMPF